MLAFRITFPKLAYCKGYILYREWHGESGDDTLQLSLPMDMIVLALHYLHDCAGHLGIA